ncbi:uncharacterized protein LOC113384989 [Ctenocephalides felis]|uniref:uncharacterized protein LOC113384989 n=1 Tax=Ctenocephalides felis TaxID=7515 RepID=UPI000E6E48E2|nr:uncharacterized protein LOC113384989 [Ctenocephalides felis]
MNYVTRCRSKFDPNWQVVPNVSIISSVSRKLHLIALFKMKSFVAFCIFVIFAIALVQGAPKQLLDVDVGLGNVYGYPEARSAYGYGYYPYAYPSVVYPAYSGLSAYVSL